MGILVDVAARLPGVTFSFVGDGPERMAIEAEVRSRGLTNVELPGFVDGEALAARYWDADVLVAHLRRDPAFAIAQPSKLWEYMAAGRPVVFGGEGEAVRILEREGIGVTVPPESADEMAAAIQGLLDDPQRAADLATRARAFVERHRNRDVLLARWESLLRAAVAR
jgi:colanic acid biosynthesis glycosyl transferase WcaI